MGATQDGGKKFRDKVLAQNPNYYSEISKRARKPRGGHNSVGDFAKNRELAQKAGSVGGKKSKRGKARPKDEIEQV